jgi:hypothetical protein
LRRGALILFCWVQEIRPMMGERRVMQEALFYGFSLERHVPDSHLLRKIDRFVDLSGLRSHLAPYYIDVGRPSIDPEQMTRMLIVGYCFGIRSERRKPQGPSPSPSSLEPFSKRHCRPQGHRWRPTRHCRPQSPPTSAKRRQPSRLTRNHPGCATPTGSAGVAPARQRPSSRGLTFNAKGGIRFNAI